MIDIDPTLINVARVALFVMVLLILAASYRVLKGPEMADRLLAIDLITTLLIGIIVLLVIIEQTTILADIGIGLAAFAFIGTLGTARYISEGRVF